MAAYRNGLGFVSLIFIAGSAVLLLFVVLSGVKDSTPLNKIWFLQADTSTIAGSGRAISQWTYFYVCGENNQNCGDPVPGLPFGYAWIGGSAGAPAHLVGSYGKDTTSFRYYYLWRFGWAFYLIALVFDVLALFTSVFAPCSRLASGFSGLVLGVGLFFMTLAASLMTITFVGARDRFHDSSIKASVGRYAFGFTWGAWAAMFLATIMLFLNCGLQSRQHTTTKRRTSKRGWFGRKGGRRSVRGSFIDSESQRRVKDEYA